MEDFKKELREILREELEPVKTEIKQLHIKVGGLEEKVGSMETKMASMETRMDGMETRMDSLELKVENGFRQASFERKMLKQMNLELLEDVKIIKEKVEYLTYQQAKNNREIYKLKRRTIR